MSDKKLEANKFKKADGNKVKTNLNKTFTPQKFLNNLTSQKLASKNAKTTGTAFKTRQERVTPKKHTEYFNKERNHDTFNLKNLSKPKIYLSNLMSKNKTINENKILFNSLVSKIKFNLKYKLINFLYISKALLKTNKLNIIPFFGKIEIIKLYQQYIVNFYLYYNKILFNLKHFLFLKYLLVLSKKKTENADKMVLKKINVIFINDLQALLQTSNFIFENLFKMTVQMDFGLNTKLNLFLIEKENLKSFSNPGSYLSYDLNYYDFISQTDINQNIKEQQFLIKKKKKLAKGTGFLFLPEKFLNKLSPQKKKLLTSYILQQQKRKKHEIYGYLSPLETKPLITKGFIRPRKKMKKLGILYYRPTRRNLKMTFVDASGQVLAYYSCGTNKKFKKARRRLKDVRERTLFKMTVQIDDLKYKRIIVAFKGSQFVKVFKVLKRRRLKIIGYSFDTLIPHNGCRKSKKKRK